ncbi:MAG: flagellar basal body P-ring formation protein FlgA, partial [Rickettsiales bacterium]|nr:flagellar basal body P-ring formation protein FlgA [Rickettsiales bacterium]
TFRAQLDVHTEDARILQALQGTHLAAIGKYEEMIAVPTVRNRIERGQIIAQGDLDWVTMPRRRVNGDMVLEPESLLSMQAARSLVPGRPVRSSDVTEPVMVERGATVTMTFATQNMELRALGEAMEDGKKGEVIKVRNTESGKVVFAKVEGPSMLKVNFMPKLAQKSARQQTAMQ